MTTLETIMHHTTNEISATEFKATCLKVMDEVHNKHITKRVKHFAMIVPVPERETTALFGCMANMATIQGDIVAPILEEWEANE
jgi:antitoxin (DNA-binding transcriptional repressor) of toxin-antitoxin stability system